MVPVLKGLKGKKADQEPRILLLGLQGVGKTTLLKKLLDEDVCHVVPTQGFNLKSIMCDGLKLNVWDIGGEAAIRQYWRNYFDNTDILVYVIDSSDVRRLDEAKRELESLLAAAELSAVPLLVFANKQDLETAISIEEVNRLLCLPDIRDRVWHLQGCSGIIGEGLQEGITWCIQQLHSKSRIT